MSDRTAEALELLSSVEMATRSMQHVLDAWEAAERAAPRAIVAATSTYPFKLSLDEQVSAWRDTIKAEVFP
jgi:hypothetical protein